MESNESVVAQDQEEQQQQQQDDAKSVSSVTQQSPPILNLPPVCQICGLSLRIDNSIEQLNETQYKQLTCSFPIRDDMDTVTTISDADMEMSLSANILGAASTISNEMCPRNAASAYFEPVCQKSVPPRNFYACNASMADSIAQNQNSNEALSGWSMRINATSALFDIMSSNTTIDHPLCEECADLLISQLDVQCKLIQDEQSKFKQLLEKLNEETVTEDELNDLEKELKQLENEEQDLIKQLEKCEEEEKDLKNQIEQKLEEEQKLKDDEEKYLIEYANARRTLMKQEEKQTSLDNQFKQSKIHYNRLKTSSVLNATFHIWHSGPFGTINFFRLGRTPDTPVEWDEINAALGQVALLLHSLARQVKLEFKRYKLVPFGNYSYIEAIENVNNLGVKKGDQLHMYGAGGFKYYFEWDKKFDIGMVAFLDCLQQFEERIKALDNTFSMPYPINGHCLEDKKTMSRYSIKCHFNSLEEWTKALKYMLTNLKWSLVWVASQY